MSERDFDRFSDEEFEKFLQEEASDIDIGEKSLKKVNPWKKSTDMIFAGLVLQLFGIGIFYLNYILPLVGSLLIVIGFRMLSNENKWFKAGFIFSLLRSCAQVVGLILESALIKDQALQTFLSWPWSVINAVLILGTVGCLWGGFRGVQKKAGVPVRTKSLCALFLIYLLPPLLFLINIRLALLLIFLPALLITVVVCFRRIIKDISASGYSVRPKAVKFPNWAIVTIFMTITIAGVLIGNFFFTSYPMDYKPLENSQKEEILSAKERLLQMNFPEQFIDDLTEADLEECADPVRVVVTDETELDRIGDLCLQYVFIQLEAEEETWKIFCFYNWTEPPAVYRTDCIYVEPLYSASNLANWEKAGEISGQVLCEKDGKTYVSPYHSLSETMIGRQERQTPLFLSGDGSEKSGVLGKMSFLAGSENCRGYIAHKVRLNSELDFEKVHVYYCYGEGFIYPYEEMSENFWEYASHNEVMFTGSNLSFYKFPYYEVADR